MSPATFTGFFLVLLSSANVVAYICFDDVLQTCHWASLESWSSCNRISIKTRYRKQQPVGDSCSCGVSPQKETSRVFQVSPRCKADFHTINTRLNGTNIFLHYSVTY